MLTKAVEKLFYLAVVLFSAILLLTVFLNERPSFYQKIDPKVCTEATATFDFNDKTLAKLVAPVAKPKCSDWKATVLPLFRQMPDYAELPPQLPLEKLWLQFNYQVPAELESDDGLALYSTRIVGGIVALYVDDKLMYTNEDDWHMQWNQPFLVKIPMYSVKPGQSINIKLAIPYRQIEGYSIGSFYLGEAGLLKNWQNQRQFFSIQLPVVLSFLFFIFGVVSLFLALFQIERVKNLLFFVIALIYLVCNMQYMYNASGDGAIYSWYQTITDASISWLMAISTIYASYYAKTNLRWLVNLAAGWAVLITVTTMPVWQEAVISFLLQHYATLLLYIGIVIVVIFKAIKEKNGYLAVISACIVIYLAGGAYDLAHVSNQTDPDGYYIFPYTTIPLMLFFLVMLQVKYISSQKQLLKSNETMQQRLVEQELRLNEQHQQLLQQSRHIAEQDAIYKERVRLKQDLHDGVVSSLYLLGLNLPGKSSEMQQALQELADDIQCVVLSLQQDASLNDALAAYRSRIAGRLAGTGIELVWQVVDVSELNWLEPSDVLNILRLVQEATGNALKHAECSVLTISARVNSESTMVELKVTDNGKGYDLNSTSTGNGRRNMQHRAHALGATLHRSSGEQGTAVTLLIPLQKPARD